MCNLLTGKREIGPLDDDFKPLDETLDSKDVFNVTILNGVCRWLTFAQLFGDKICIAGKWNAHKNCLNPLRSKGRSYDPLGPS